MIIYIFIYDFIIESLIGQPDSAEFAGVLQYTTFDQIRLNDCDLFRNHS